MKWLYAILTCSYILLLVGCIVGFAWEMLTRKRRIKECKELAGDDEDGIMLR